MCVWLPELHSHLLSWVHHLVLYRWLWLHRDKLPARQGVCVFLHSCFGAYELFAALWLLCVCPGVCGWRCGVSSGERMGGGVSEMQVHRVTGQTHITARRSVHPACLWSILPPGKTHAHTYSHTYTHSDCTSANGNGSISLILQGSSYTPSQGECCGKCTETSCMESEGEMRGDTLIGGQLRHVCVLDARLESNNICN